MAGAYLTAMDLPVLLPDPLSLIETPHIPFGWGGGVAQMGVGMGCATSAPVIIDPKNEKYSWLAYKKKKRTKKKRTLEPKQRQPVVAWAHVPSEMRPLAALAGVGVGVGVVTAGGDRVLVVVEV